MEWGGGASSGVSPPLLRGQSHPAVSGSTTFPNERRIASQPVGEDCWNAVRVRMFQSESADDRSGNTRVMSNQGTRLKCLQYLRPRPASPSPLHDAFRSRGGGRHPRHRVIPGGDHRLSNWVIAQPMMRNADFFQPRFGSTKPNILSQMLDKVSRPCLQRRSPGVLRGKKT